MHVGFLAFNYYFSGGYLQLATEFQAQAALATICRRTAGKRLAKGQWLAD
jgi:hypothetical protein